MDFNYPHTLKVPRRAGETTEPPQLMTRFLGNLIAHMWGGQYDFLCPTTLRVSVQSSEIDRQLSIIADSARTIQ